MNQDAFETAVLWVFGVIGVVLGVGILVACIVGPLTGHWEPDLGLAFWLVVAGAVYVVYRVVS
jgi:uncharacterized membrane protein HdeD (DUF308 family)